MSWFLERAYYAAIVAMLVGGDIQAKMVSNPAGDVSIRLTMIDGSEVLWSNATDLTWKCSIVTPEGDIKAFHSDLPWASVAEDVAKMIATHEYPAPVAYPVD